MRQKTLRPPLVLTFTLIIVALIVLLSFKPHPAPAAAPVIFEFSTGSNIHRTQANFPYGRQNNITVVSQGADVLTLLPLSLNLSQNGQTVWQKEITKPDCYYCSTHRADICVISGPNLPDPGNSTLTKLTAHTSDGAEITSYQEGNPPSAGENAKELNPPEATAIVTATVAASPVPTIPKSSSPFGLIVLIIIAVAVATGAIIFLSVTTGSGPGCPDVCTLGHCRNCRVAKLCLVNTGTDPDATWWDMFWVKALRILITLTPGTTPLSKQADIITQGMEQLAATQREKERILQGVELYAYLEWEECHLVPCRRWKFWQINMHNDWVPKSAKIKIDPPPEFQKGQHALHDLLEAHGASGVWSATYLLDPANKKAIALHIVQAAKKSIPCKCDDEGMEVEGEKIDENEISGADLEELKKLDAEITREMKKDKLKRRK